MRARRFAVGARLLLCAAAFAVCAPTMVAAQESDPTTGRIAYIEPADPPGKLKVKQKKGEVPADATVGMTVRRGYLLTLAPTARAAVYCADGTKHDLQPGPQGCPCIAVVRGTIYDGSTIPRARGMDTARGTFPVIVSPRKTLLLTTRPNIEWSPLAASADAAAPTYRVSVYTDAMELVWRKEDVTTTEMAYPAGEKELVRGEVYKVVVQSGKTSSQQERSADLGFTVLTETEAKSIGEAEGSLRRLDLPADETRLLVADLYAARGLSSEAVELLTSLPDALKGPAVLRMLGDLYATAGLHREAVNNYEKALALPQIKTDTEGQALTLAALGRSYATLGNGEQARERFASAVEAFRKLGDNVTIEQLKDGRLDKEQLQDEKLNREKLNQEQLEREKSIKEKPSKENRR